MKNSRFHQVKLQLFLSVGIVALSAPAADSPRPGPVRAPGQAVNEAGLRQLPGLRPDESLLFNGWGVTPAGEQAAVSDMPLKLVVSPDKKLLAAVCAGFSNTGLALFDIASRKLTQFFPLKKLWNGVAFSEDSQRLFVSGGDSGQIYVYRLQGGKAVTNGVVTPAPDAAPVFLAAIAVHPKTGKLYVCNEANHEIWVLNQDSLALETTIPVGLHPIACTFGADKMHLYVSDWGSRSVSVVDTRNQPPRSEHWRRAAPKRFRPGA